MSGLRKSVSSACAYRSASSRLAQVQRQYDSDEEDEDEMDDGLEDSDEAPELITTREDFDTMMNEFLDNYEILGGKMQPVLPGDTATEKLDTLRKALGQARLRDGDEDYDSEVDDVLMPLDIDEKQDRWDCETILSWWTCLLHHSS